MNFTENEILILKKHIVANNVPINFEIISKGKIELKYKNDIEVYANLTKLFKYECTSKLPDGQYYVFSITDLNQFLYDLKKWINRIKLDYPIIIHKSEFIENFSSRFYKVYNEAILINCLNYKESAGMIYRKSLEILIKDFLLYFIPEFQEIILNETIGGIVFFFYDVKNEKFEPRQKRSYKKRNIDLTQITVKLNEILPFVIFVDKTFKIGNDFSHYERKLENYTTEDLENNIKLILDYLINKVYILENINQLEEKHINFKNYKLNK